MPAKAKPAPEPEASPVEWTEREATLTPAKAAKLIGGPKLDAPVVVTFRLPFVAGDAAATAKLYSLEESDVVAGFLTNECVNIQEGVRVFVARYIRSGKPMSGLAVAVQSYVDDRVAKSRPTAIPLAVDVAKDLGKLGLDPDVAAAVAQVVADAERKRREAKRAKRAKPKS